jgi:hypothetical protein
MPNMSVDVAGVLAEAEWLTRLARSLTGDSAEAADAVQETFVAALRSPPDPERPVRPWLRRVLTNNSPDDGVVSDASGGYRLDGVSAGDVTVICGTNSVHGMRFATVPRGTTAQLDVYVVAGNGQPGTIDAQFRMMESRTFDEIDVGGAAQQAGLLVGDEVIAVDGTSMSDLTGWSVMRVITQRGGGKPAVLTIQRGGTMRTVTVVVRTPDN